MRARVCSCAFTMVELLVVVVVIVIGAGLLVATCTPTRHGRVAGALKDASQIRDINYAMVLWAQGNRDQYPLPSAADAAGATLAGPPEAKDTTSNIMSMMIYAGYFSPDLAVSTAEASPNIRVMGDYQYSSPDHAADPAKALWDPGFNADFTNGVGNTSYAHLLPSGARLKEWKSTSNGLMPIVGNRGPQIGSVAYDSAGEPMAHRVLATSTTDLIHGGRWTWEGNICYNDVHVSFETSLAPPGVVWRDATGKAFGDVMFHAEPKDPARADVFLGIFVRAGATADDFTAIWD